MAQKVARDPEEDASSKRGKLLATSAKTNRTLARSDTTPACISRHAGRQVCDESPPRNMPTAQKNIKLLTYTYDIHIYIYIYLYTCIHMCVSIHYMWTSQCQMEATKLPVQRKLNSSMCLCGLPRQAPRRTGPWSPGGTHRDASEPLPQLFIPTLAHCSTSLLSAESLLSHVSCGSMGYTH